MQLWLVGVCEAIVVDVIGAEETLELGGFQSRVI